MNRSPAATLYYRIIVRCNMNGVPRAPRPLPLFLELVREVSERDPELGARSARRIARLRAGRAASAAVAEAGGRARARRVPARSRRRRPAGAAGAVADQPAAHPRPRRAGVARRRGRAHGPPRRCCSTGASARARRTSTSPVTSSNCCCRCCAASASRLRWSAIASAARWRSPPPTSSSRACRHPRRAVAFRAYPEARAPRCRTCGATRGRGREGLGALPMEVLQATFWSLDPERTVASSPSSPASIRQAPKRGASSSSRIGPTRASPCPTRRRAS